MSILSSGLQLGQLDLSLEPVGAASGWSDFYNRRNVDSQRHYDPLRNSHSYSHKESHQWARPTGHNQFQQYSKVVDENVTDAPDVHRCQRGRYEYLTSESPATRTKASRSEQSFQETRRLEGNRRVQYKATSVKVESYSTTTTAANKHIHKGSSSARRTRPQLGLDPQPVHSYTADHPKDSPRLLTNAGLKVADPLDHSLQIDKKNLSKHGSLSRRRRPSRSNRKRLNMSEIFPNNSDAKYEGETGSSSSSSPSHSPPPPKSREHPQNGQGSLLAREISRKDKPTANGHSKYINYEMKETSKRFSGNKEVQSSKDPDLIRDVKLSKDLTKSTTNTSHHQQQPQQQQQQTNRYVNRQHVFINSQRVNEGEDDKMNEHTSGNWLQEAKLKLRKSLSNPAETSNGVTHDTTSHVSVVSTHENGRVIKIADDGRSEKQKLKENGHANGDGPTVTKGHRVFVSGNSKPMNGHADECANSHVNNNHVVTNEEVGRSKRVNNNDQSTSTTKLTVRPRVSFDGEVYVNNRRHSMDSVETESEEEEMYEESQAYQSNVTSSLEKNKSKSTSNLDDDETIEAPWFRDLKYQKMSSRMKANKKMAKSSINLRWSSTNGEPLVVPVASHGNHQCYNAPATSSEVKIISNNRNNSSQMTTDDKEKVSINGGQKSGSRLENQTTKVVINGCSRSRHGPRPPLITTGVIPQRLTSVRNAEHVTNQCSVRSHLCRNPVNDNVVIIGKNNGSNALVVEGERTSLSHDRYATHCVSQKKQQKAECSIDTERQCCTYDTEARLPKEELIRRSLIDWDSLDRPKNSLTTEDSNRSNWLRDVKLRKTTCSTGDLLEDHDSRSNNNNNMAVSPSESSDCHTKNERYLSSPGLSSTLFLDSEGTDDDVSNARSIDVGLIKLQLADKRTTVAVKPAAAEESEFDSDLGGSIRFGDESGSDEWRRNSFYESETWRKLEQSLQQVNRMKNGDDGHPEWVKEAERKKHSWLSLNNLNVESGSYSTNGVSDVKPSWLDEVNQKRSSSSNNTTARSTPINQSSVQSRATYPLGEQDLPKIEIVEKGSSSISNAAIDDDNNVSRVCVRVNGGGGTGWTYVTSTPPIHVIERYQVSPNSLDFNSSLDDEISEVHSSSTVKSSDHDNDFRRQIQVDHSNFNVEHYVRDLISRRRTEGAKRPSVDTPTPPSCSPDWLQRSLQTQRNLIDWNSLERLNCSSDGHDGAVLESVTLRKVPKVRKIMTEETRIIAALKPVNRRPQGSTSSDLSDEWADAVEHHETKHSNASFDMEDEDRREPKDDEDVFSDKCLKVKGETELRQVANSIRSGSVDWTQLESGRGVSRSEAPWVTEIHLRPSSRSPTPISQAQVQTPSPKRITSVIMPCIRSHGKQTNGDSTCITDDEIDEDEEELGRKLRTGPKVDLPATKKVTFCIPNASGTTENKEDPEWIKLAEAKCKKTIKWEDLEKHEATPKATSSTTTWITQVHLKHVPVSLETIDVPIPQREDVVQQPRIKVNLRHVASPTQTELKMDDRDKRPSTIEADDIVRTSGNDVDGHSHVKNGHQQLKSPQPDAGGQVKEEPDWLKVARQKKQVYVDWEQLGSSKKSLPGDRPLPVIKEDNQPVNGFSSSNSSNSDHAEQTNGFSKPHWQSEGKVKNGVEGKSTTSDSPYRTWVVNKQRASRSATQNVASRWQSDPQLNTAPPSTTPGWFKLAEKKRNSVADWSTIERSPSPVSVMGSSWMQEVRLRTPSPTPSPQPELEDDSKCTSPFPVQLRHVEEVKLKPALLELDERNSPWISRSNSAEIDKWQIRYRELFEDLSDEPSPTEDTGTVNAFFDDYHVPLAPPESTISYPQQSPQTHSNSSSPRRLRNVNYDGNRQRRRLDAQHRYYSLPEMSAIPRSANELEIVHLNGSESPLSVDERPPTIPESPTSDENDIQEEKLIPFIRLRPTEKKETTRDTSPSREVEPFWLKEIKLRKVAIKETEELQSKLSRCLSDELREDERRSPSNVPHDFSYPRIPRTCSAPSHISSSLTIREAIHRDLKLEVARREQMKANVVSNANDKNTDNSLYTSVAPSPPPPNVQPQINGSASTANRHKTETTIILTTENAVEQDDESVYHKKPVWLEELQQKKISLKRTEETDHPVERSPKRSPITKPETPSFQNVLEEIKNKGKEKLFSSLRHRRKDNHSPDKVEPQQYLNSSGSSESSTPVSVLSDDDSSTQGSTTAFTISENSDSDFAVVIHDDDDDFLHRKNNSHSQEVKCKRFRPVSAPITVDHILQQHSQQLIDNNRFVSIKNGNSPVKEEPKLKTLEETENQEDVTQKETTPTLSNADLNGICEERTDQPATDIDDQDVLAEDPDETKSKASLEDLKSPLLLLNLLSRFSKSCSETNLTALGAPSAKSRFEAATSRMTSSCSNLVLPAANKHGFHQFDDLSWSSGASVVAARSNHTCNSSINELVPTVASSSSASDLEVYEEAESETYEHCKSQFSLQLRASTVNSAITNSDRHDSEISLD